MARESSHMDEQQIQAYVTWVNSQLRKHPAARPIEDLRCDMQDGVALAQLIRIVAGEPLAGVHESPATTEEKLYNIERVLQFMTERRIRMHHTSSQDIVAGNLKSIMRLILALAAHFKPSSVKSSSSYRNSPTSASVSGLAQSAATALADARRDVQTYGGQRVRRPKTLVTRGHGQRHSGTGSDSDPVYTTEKTRPLRPHSRDHLLDGAPAVSSGSSPASSARGSPRPASRPDYGSAAAMSKSRSQDFEPVHQRMRPPPEPTIPEAEHQRVLSDLRAEHAQLNEDMFNTKSQLLALQHLESGVSEQSDLEGNDPLLSGQPPDGAESPEGSESGAAPAEGATADEKLVVLRAKLQQAEEACRGLREDLNRVRQENRQLQGTKAGLQQRLNEQEESFLSMKAELLRVGFAQQSLETEKGDLAQKLAERDRQLYEMRRDMATKDRQLDELVANAQVQAQEKEAVTRSMRAQIQELHDKLRRVGDTEQSLSARVQQQDAKMARLEGRIMQSTGAPQYPDPAAGGARPASARSVHSTGSDELQMVRESIRSLRTTLPSGNAHHQTIDQLEESISCLMEKVNVTEHSRLNSDSGSTAGRRRVDMGDGRQAQQTYQGYVINTPQWPGDSSVQSSRSGSSGSTKVLYFTDRTVTPFMCTIHKRLGEVVLRDIKELYDRQGNYRYHFKAMDPEFGTVKEEITADDDIIPGWEGKIVAWIEEDHG